MLHTDRVRFALFFLVIPLLMPQSSPPKILVHGHRGARAVRPENTLPAFEYAIQIGVDALEMDMAVTRDNVIVISHDPILEGQSTDHEAFIDGWT